MRVRAGGADILSIFSPPSEGYSHAFNDDRVSVPSKLMVMNPHLAITVEEC